MIGQDESRKDNFHYNTLTLYQMSKRIPAVLDESIASHTVIESLDFDQKDNCGFYTIRFANPHAEFDFTVYAHDEGVELMENFSMGTKKKMGQIRSKVYAYLQIKFSILGSVSITRDEEFV